MLCTDCGSENPKEARFCNSCGLRLDVPETAAPAAPKVQVRSGFVGRQREMGQLVAALDDALSGRGRLVMLVGEPGIGKTRTAQELAAIASGRGARVLWGRCLEGQGAPPYWPWIQPIRAYVQQADPETLLSHMGQGAADIAEIVPEIKAVVGAPPLQPPPQLEPEQARFRLFDSITTFLKSLSREQPLTLILDNLHWADRPSLLLLEFLAPELESRGILIVGTYRDMELSRGHPLAQTLGELTRNQAFQRVLLRGLSQDDVGRYVEMASHVAPAPSLVSAIYTQSEGNPLFVTELVRLLEHDLSADGSTEPVLSWSKDSPRTEILGGRVPEGIREVIGRRLDRLSEGCNRALTVASVMGRECSFDALVRLVEGLSEDSLMDALEEAIRIGIIDEVEDEAGRYQFSHALIGQTLAEELSAARRVRLHARIAVALEELYAPDVEAHATALAYHFGEAQAVLGTGKLVKYSMMAGQQALAAYAWEEALAHFERALAAREGQSPSASSGQAVDDETAAMLFGRGQARSSWEDGRKPWMTWSRSLTTT